MHNMDIHDHIDRDAIRGKKLLVGLSGGADSVCLVRLLRDELAGGVIRGLGAAHFHHGIRGTDADRDARFAEEVAAELGIPFYTAKVSVPDMALKRGMGLESAAREARYRFLEETRREHGYDLIALAHHADDNAETVLMHLLRGAGIKGLAGIRPVAGKLVRPILGLTKSEITGYLVQNGFSWREDATNLVADNPRNILRLEVFPRLEKCYPGAGAALVRLAENCRVEDEYLDRVTRDYIRAHAVRGPYGVKIDLSAMPDRAILRRVIRFFTGQEVYAEGIDRIESVTRENGKKTPVRNGITAERYRDQLYFLQDAPEKTELPLETDGETVLPGVCRAVCRVAGSGPDDAPDGHDQWDAREVIDISALRGAVLRTRRTGDRIMPLGMTGSQSLGDRMTNRHIPRPERDTLPVIAVGSEIIWAAGCGISAKAAVTDSTVHTVEIKIYNQESVDNASGCRENTSQ